MDEIHFEPIPKDCDAYKIRGKKGGFVFGEDDPDFRMICEIDQDGLAHLSMIAGIVGLKIMYRIRDRLKALGVKRIIWERLDDEKRKLRYIEGKIR